MKISIKLVCQYITIFFNFAFTLSHLYPLQVENCDSNSRLVADEDDNSKFRLEKVKSLVSQDVIQWSHFLYIFITLISMASVNKLCVTATTKTSNLFTKLRVTVNIIVTSVKWTSRQHC